MSEEEVFNPEPSATALRGGAKPGNANGRLIIKDRIADSMFQQIQLRPDEYSVVATPNLNGDYLSDAPAATTGDISPAAAPTIADRAPTRASLHCGRRRGPCSGRVL